MKKKLEEASRVARPLRSYKKYNRKKKRENATVHSTNKNWSI